MNQLLEQIQEYMLGALILFYKGSFPDTLDDDIQIIYNNGSDGTAFDWNKNKALPRFYIEDTNGEAVLSGRVQADGYLVIQYGAGHLNTKDSVIKLECESDELWDLAAILYYQFDKAGLYNEPIDSVNTDILLTVSQVEDFMQAL